MIRTALIEDVEELKTIWSKIFGDEDELIENFFALFDEIDSLVYETDGRIVSMLYMINAETSTYLYGLATLNEYRGRGYMGKLIEYALNKASGTEYIFLMPAEESLYGYYERYGFKDKTYTYSYGYDKSFEKMIPVNMEEIMEFVTKDYECTNNFVKFGQNIIKYVLTEEDWKFYKVIFRGREAGYAIMLDDRIKYYGMSRDAYEAMGLQKFADSVMLMKGVHGRVEGFIPF